MEALGENPSPYLFQVLEATSSLDVESHLQISLSASLFNSRGLL